MRTKIATVPRLVEAKGEWYVYFSVRHPLTGKMVPQKIYRGFKDKSRKEKQSWGESLVKEYTAKLKTGWNPLDSDEKVIYNDQVEYANLAKKFSRQRKTVRNTRYFISEYLAERRTELRDKTYFTYQSKLRILCNWLDFDGYRDYDVSSIDTKIIKRFFDFLVIDQELDKVTILKYRQIIRSYFDWLKKKGRILENPVQDIKTPPKKKDEAARPINQRDLKILLEAIKKEDPQLYLVCMFEYYTAMRPGQEIRLLRVKDLDVYNNTVTITDGIAKTVRRTVDMPKQLSELCMKHKIHQYNREFYVFGNKGIPGDVPVGKNNFRNRFNAIRDRLSLPKIYKLYSMKHTGLGRLIESGRTLEEIRDHAGHRSIESTERYIRQHFGSRNKNIINNFPEP